MAEHVFEEPPPQWRVLLTLLSCVLLAGFLQIFAEKACDNFVMRALGSPELAIGLIKLTLAVMLCVFTFRASGLTLGEKAGWRKHLLAVAFVWVLPLIVVAILYPALGFRAQANARTYASWLIVPLAEQLLFSGFIYGQMKAVFGKPSMSWTGGLEAAPLITAFSFALYFWPALRLSDEVVALGTPSAIFQMASAFIYSAWILNVRRLTGTVWPCVFNHVLISLLITVR